MVRRKFGHPCAEKEARLRSQQQLSGSTVASTYSRQAPRMCVGHCFGITLSEARRKTNVSEPALVAGVGRHRQGTLTITGSNARLGAEMPVALPTFR
jgi:hypothetical protein